MKKETTWYRMEFRDLKRQYAALQPEMDRAMAEVLEAGAFIMGRQVRELESSLAACTGVHHCLSCASGTDALVLALKALGIGPGDAVFVPDFTFFATAESVSMVGATPVFVDVCPDTFNLDASDLDRAISAILGEGRLRPQAVIAVDLFGLPADYPAIGQVASRYGLKIIEDGAQGFGGSIGGKRACSFGDISTTSFFPAKPLGCYGDGGAVFTDSDELAALVTSYRVHGKGENKYDNVRIGMNSRLDTLQAAILQVKLQAFEAYELSAVQKAADRYTERLSGKVTTPVVPSGYASSWAQYTIRLESRQQRDAVQAALKAEGIPSCVYYPRPMHLQPAFSGLAPAESCPVATQLCTQVLSLPLHPYLTEEETDFVCGQLLTAMDKA